MTRRPSGRASKACRPTWPGSASTRWWASPSRPCPPSRWTAGRFLFTNANTPYIYNTRCLNTLELYVDNIFVVNQQMTLDQAAQETVNPPWPTLKSLKLGGMVGGHLFCGIFWPPCFRWQQEQCWSISWKVVSTSGFSATVFMKIRFVYLYCCHTFCSHICAQQAFREWCVCCYCLLILTFSSDLCVTGALSDGRLCRRLAPAQPDASACRFLLWEVRSHWGGAQFPTLNPTTTIFCFIFTLQIIGSLMIKLIQSFFLLVQSLPSLRFLGILSEWVFDNNTGGKKSGIFWT